MAKRKGGDPAGSDGNGNGNGRGPGQRIPAAAGGPEVKTDHEGEPSPGRIARTWDQSEPAFPVGAWRH